jgi:hypothetical protein
VVCSLETSSQLAGPGVNCSLSGDVLTPPLSMSMKKTEDTPLRMLEGETGYFTTQLSLVVRLLREDGSCEIVGLGNEEHQCKAACSHQLPCFCARCCPCHFALTCCIGLNRFSPRSVLERSNIQMQGAWHSSIEERQYFIGHTGAWQIIALRGKRNLCSESMLRRYTVRHEPSNILYSQVVICEPPKIIKRPSFDSQLRGQGVDTTELPTRS